MVIIYHVSYPKVLLLTINLVLQRFRLDINLFSIVHEIEVSVPKVPCTIGSLLNTVLSPTFAKFGNCVIIDLKSNIKWDLAYQMFQVPCTFFQVLFY